MRRVKVTTKLFAPVCILSSAAFYAASFLIKFCWWVSFCCFVPLFFQRFSSYRCALGAGFLWGVVAYGLTLSALLEVMIRLGESPIKYLYALGFLGYFVFFSMMWCVLALFFKKTTKSWGWGWFLSSLFYFSWVYIDFFYFLTGRHYGYPLACPLVPLIQRPAFLGLLPSVGWCIFLGALLCFQVGVSQRNKMVMVLGVVPFLLGLCVNNQNVIEQKGIHKIVIISRMFYQTTPYERAQELYNALCDAQQVHSQACLFVFPESAFPFPLNEYRYVQELLSESCNDGYVVLGSHYSDVSVDKKNVLYNSAYVLHKGRIIHRYDKRLLLPFFEEQSTQSFFLQKVPSPFLEKKCSFIAQVVEPQPCFVPGAGTFSFRMCSELLWDIPKGENVLLLVNDSHYAYEYFQHLFRSFAHFQALEKKSILYYCGWQKFETFL